MKYPKERKEAILKKTPPPQSIADLAKVKNICKATLYHWRQAARAEGRLLPDGDSTPSGWTAADKFAAVVEMSAQRFVGLDKAILAVRKRVYEVTKQQRPERSGAAKLETGRLSKIVWLSPENTAVANETINKKAT
jgi:transposase-like protein